MQYAVLAQLIASYMAQGQSDKALAMRQEAADLYGQDKLPQLDQMVAIQLPKGMIDRWTQATQATNAQQQSLTALSQEVAAKGETPEDRAAYMQARNEAMGVAQAGQGQAMRGLAARGLSNSGLALAASMQAGQAGANMASQMDVQNAANSRERYLRAVGMLGSEAGQVRGQEMQAMSAQDALNQFNAVNAMRAQEYNLGLPQQQFNNQMQLSSGKANALNGVANQYNTMSGQTLATGAGIGQGLASYAQYQNQNHGPNGMTAPEDNPWGPGGGAPAWSGYDTNWQNPYGYGNG